MTSPTDTSTTASPVADTTPPPPAAVDTVKTFDQVASQLSSEQANEAIVAMFSNLSPQDLAELRPELLKIDRKTRWNLVTMLLDNADRGNIIGVLESWLANTENVSPEGRNVIAYYIESLSR